VQVAQPAFWRAHIAALALRKRGVDRREMVETLLAVASKTQSDASVLRLAADIATSTRAEIFDTMYHATAITEGIELVTANADYIERAGHLNHICLLEDWAARARIAERDKRYSRRDANDLPTIRQKKR
jgi:predicted nucleic acid-binding protein